MKIKRKERSRFLIPDGLLESIYDVTPELLAQLDIKGLVCDIDNTLVPYNVATPCEKLKAHLRSFEQHGIEVAFVSNNKRQRVKKFNRRLRFFAVWDSGKPFGGGIGRCIRHMGHDKENILLVGDQIYTDCLGAHISGVRCFIVPPIEPKENFFFKLKRFLEKPILYLYRRANDTQETE
ncbi:MAG TPA: YqeG family HAD IIIA-type phosphatase [Bacillota bacterium]|nr:YqeG family HAD IIIA-type phosphatase [Bacillota bacterium]